MEQTLDLSVTDKVRDQILYLEDQEIANLLRKHLLDKFDTPEKLLEAGYVLNKQVFPDGRVKWILAKVIDSISWKTNIDFKIVD